MEQSVSSLLEEGLRLQQRGLLTEAISRYERVLRAEPSSVDAIYYLAVSVCQQGDLEKGISLARRALALDQQHAKSNNLLGKALHGSGRHAEALEYFDRAIASAPDFAEAHGNRAALLMDLRKWPEALASYDRAVVLNPHSIADWQDRGALLAVLKRYDEAVASYDHVLALDPDLFEAHVARAEFLLALDRLDEAQAGIQKALSLRPRDPEALVVLARILLKADQPSDALAALDQALSESASPPLLMHRGFILGRLGRHEEALASFQQCLALQPNSLDALLNSATALCELGRYAEALSGFGRASVMRPQDPMVYFGRGNALAGLRRHAEALSAYDGCLALRPRDASALCGRGYMQLELGRHQEALASFDQALAIQPAYAEALINRGLAMAELRRHEEAFRNFELAQSIEPNLAKAHWNEALLRLLLGDYAGWKKYEWRWQEKSPGTQQREFPVPAWSGEELRDGATILVYAEQGYGDAIQFARFMPNVARLGANVIFEVPPALKPLYEGMSGASVVGRGETLRRFDLHCPLLSLPLRLGTTLETIPAAGPSLAVPPERVARWRDQIPRGQRLKVGIAWSGNPQFHRDLQRSMSLDRFMPLLDIPGISFVTLNPGILPAEASKLAQRGNVVDLAEGFVDFADTAAVIADLDLVISTDTSIVHLAGTLGKPVWILLSYIADWRWMLDRDDSPWYPTARLFRQSKRDDWKGVVERVAEQLTAFAAN